MGTKVNVWTAEDSRDHIFYLALQIARLRSHSAYLENGILILVAHDDVEKYEQQFYHEIIHEAKGLLMRGGWEGLRKEE
jgi:hypothetical protein